MTAWGIDISNHQAGADLAKAKAAGCGFVFAKATEGLTWRDDHFAGFRAQAAKIGLPFGAYHFARPQAGRTGTDEARAFLAVAGKPDGMPHVLDLEDTKISQQATAAFALEWLAYVHKATGVRPILYTYTAFAASRLSPVAALAAYPLWLANYTSVTPPAPKPWRAWVAWQHTSRATVPGIPGACDRNIAATGFPPQSATAQEDDMPSAEEVAHDVWAYDQGNLKRQAWGYLQTADANARAARQLAAESNGIVKALAAKPQGLSAAEIEAAAKAGAKAGVAEALDAQDFADAIPDNLAQQVVDLLAARLAPKETA